MGHPNCGVDGLGFSAAYDTNGNFNFQHILFLLNQANHTGFSSFQLECSVEICKKNDANSLCNRAAPVCMATVEEKKSYKCNGYPCTEAAEVCGVDDATSSPVCR